MLMIDGLLDDARRQLRAKAEIAISKGVCVFVSEWGAVNADGNG
jgi:hypothetical protein